MGGVVDTLLFQPPTPPTPIRLRASSNSSAMELVWLKTIHGSKIPALFLQRKYAIYTILYSHGNAEDLGMLSNYLADLSKILHVNILAYDYTGYGFSNRKLTKTGDFHTASSPPAFLPSEEHFYADISAAYDYLVTIRGISAHRIILFGRSIGSGPSCYLASKLNANKKRSEMGGCESSAAGLCTSCASLDGSVIFDDLSLELNHGAEGSNSSEYIAGLILHSPFASVYRVVIDMGFTAYQDPFANIDRIGDVGCPVLIIHGTNDEVVPFKHGQMLYNLIPDRHKVFEPYWAKDMGHNNIEVECTTSFVWNLMEFLQLLRRREYLGFDRFRGPCQASSDPPELTKAFVQRHVMLMIDREIKPATHLPASDPNIRIPPKSVTELRSKKIRQREGNEEVQVAYLKKGCLSEIGSSQLFCIS
eukprot:CAMPEP_0172422680 /NCGR_PEP_ID=MMETSP1064-20121228/8805_1 /TAXON_ID=202472 /ORGANISM="Aulacoseira subarctica , Strain CCAP 1002/5" /LENGTH=418 /DNA_ID=CAMNT_0013163647 /DNA_START=169 /DNA_END=1425 /DNA_ORIENTATION=-